MKIVKLSIAFFIIICFLVIYLSNQPPILLLTIKGNDLYCEIADTLEKRQTGLSNRKSLGENNGMIFIYKDKKMRTYHMADCYIPLSIVFADENGIIVHMTEMPMNDKTVSLENEKTYSSEKEAMYAVEANKGWFTSHKIAVGDKIAGLQAYYKK